MNAQQLRDAWAIGVKPTAAFKNLRGANLYGADLRGADLRGADLTGAIGYQEATA